MKNPPNLAQNLETFLKRLPAGTDPGMPDPSDPVAVMVFSFLLWEHTTSGAIEAFLRFRDTFIDYNELRVSLPYEIARGLGLDDPLAIGRCQRLRASLNEIFRREHVVSLDRLRPLGKREIRRFLDELEGMVPFVAARVCLLCFDTHTIPVDERLRALLIAEAGADPQADLVEISNWVSRHVKASQGRSTHFALQAAVERGGKPDTEPGTGRRAPKRREGPGGKRKAAPTRKS